MLHCPITWMLAIRKDLNLSHLYDVKPAEDLPYFRLSHFCWIPWNFYVNATSLQSFITLEKAIFYTNCSFQQHGIPVVYNMLFFSHVFESWSEVHAHCLQFEILPFHISNSVIASHLAQLVFQHQTWLVQFCHFAKWNASSTYHLWGNSAKDI